MMIKLPTMTTTAELAVGSIHRGYAVSQQMTTTIRRRALEPRRSYARPAVPAARRGVVTVWAATLALLAAGCDAGMPRGTAPDVAAPRVLEVIFSTGAGGEAGRFETDVITDQAKHLRMTSRLFGNPDSTKPNEVVTWVWDGKRLLMSSSTSGIQPSYTLYEAPLEQPEVWSGLWGLRRDLTEADPNVKCTKLSGNRRILGRRADGYHCERPNVGVGGSFSGDLWVDHECGLLLETVGQHAQRLVGNPRVDRSTFSTTPPKGAKFTVVAAKNPTSGSPRSVPPFSLELLTGGSVSGKEFAGKPYVLAFFASDLFFDTSGDVCPGCLKSLITLQKLTNNGKTPSVLAVQVGLKGKPGYPLVPPGLTLRVANDPSPTLQNSLGLSKTVGFAFVGSDGKVTVTYDRAATQQELERSLAALK